MNDDFSDLDYFADDFEPNARLAGPELLEDGTYTFEITGATLSHTEKSGDRIFRMTLNVIPDNIMLERVSFLKSQDNINIHCADMMLLGLDADQWNKNGRKLSEEIPAACDKIRGKRFRGKKVTNGDYHNIYILGLVGKGSPDKSSAPAPSLLPPSTEPGPPTEEIPF